MSKFDLFDVVALRNDLPHEDLLEGQVGTIVEVYDDGAGFEVEFVDPEGRTYGLLTLSPDQILALHYEPVKVAA